MRLLALHEYKWRGEIAKYGRPTGGSKKLNQFRIWIGSSLLYAVFMFILCHAGSEIRLQNGVSRNETWPPGIKILFGWVFWIFFDKNYV